MCCKLPRSRMLIMLGHDFLLNGEGYYLEKSLLLTHTPFPLSFPSAYFCKYIQRAAALRLLARSVSVHYTVVLFVRRKTCSFA